MNDTKLPRIFCAIDTANMDQALALAGIMYRAGCGIKLGLEFFGANGPQGIATITGKYSDVPLFLDLKFHDIPVTVAGAVRAVVRFQPAYINVHVSGGADMMKAACDAAVETSERLGIKAPKILGVTILTSLDDNDLANIGYAATVEARVPSMARLAQRNGMEGVVCAAREIEMVRKECGEDFVLMVPGIRPAGRDSDDQKRVMTPEGAILAGATHLVIGRAITQANDPASVIEAIHSDICTDEH